MTLHAPIAPPRLERTAPICPGEIVWLWGRALRVVRVAGEDPAAPVVVEELAPPAPALSGQYALWSADAVRRARVGGGWLP